VPRAVAATGAVVSDGRSDPNHLHQPRSYERPGKAISVFRNARWFQFSRVRFRGEEGDRLDVTGRTCNEKKDGQKLWVRVYEEMSKFALRGEPLARETGFQNGRDNSLLAYPMTLLQLLGLRHRRHSALSARQHVEKR
jgi:hypothetical protein